jgi:uncharacterized protein YdcH (DUF465 family)
MTNTPHELSEEFPEYADAMHRLKTTDSHFAGLAEQYHVINGAIHKAETNLSPTDDLHLTQMRKERLALKDQIAAILSQT